MSEPNLENDLMNCDWIREKCENSESYSQNLYASLCNRIFIKDGKEWYYPTNQFSWKVRFTPDTQGTWNYKIIAKDKSGASETPVKSFFVISTPIER